MLKIAIFQNTSIIMIKNQPYYNRQSYDKRLSDLLTGTRNIIYLALGQQ